MGLLVAMEIHDRNAKNDQSCTFHWDNSGLKNVYIFNYKLQERRKFKVSPVSRN